MTHSDTAYKLGALSAVNDFTAWLQNDDGNPTEYPKRRGSILKTAQGNPMQPNPGVTQQGAQPLPTGGQTGMVGGPQQGTGAAPVTPTPKLSSVIERVKMAIMGGKSQTCRDMPDVCNPGSPPTPPPKPVTPPPTKTSADRAVEQVMRKLGKSMSRRPLSRDGTKYDAIKKKLRKQKPKKA